jgi:hypothetical protein
MHGIARYASVVCIRLEHFIRMLRVVFASDHFVSVSEAIHLEEDQPTGEGLSINVVGINVAGGSAVRPHVLGQFDSPLPAVTLRLARPRNRIRE